MREMKESNIPWVGPIPKEWNVGRIKQGYDVTLGKMYAAKEQQKEDGTLENYLCAANIKWAGIDTSVHKQMYFTEKEKEQYLLNNGDAVVMEGGMAGTTCLYKGEYYPCYIQNSVHKISSKNNNSTSFFAYWMEVVCSSGYVENVCNKATIMHYTKDKVCNTPLLLIPVEEQNEIVGYLNEKCSVINSSISRHQQIIEKLEEYRKSVITQAVTKGLNPDAEMIPVHQEWISNIPKGWQVLRLKFVMDNYDFQRRPVESSKRTQNSEILYDYYGATGIIDKIDGYTCEGKKILIGEDGANLLLRNIKLIYTPTGKYWVNNHTHILYPKGNNNIDYFAAQMECIDYTKYITGSAQPKLSQRNLNNVLLVVPPIDEQNEIAEFVNNKTSFINETIERHKNIMNKLQEYKQSLIYNAVTGKIDCRTTE